jgi:arylsulfatase A-like enzyme
MQTLWTTLRLIAALTLFACSSIQVAQAKNVVLIMTDDMPWFMFDNTNAMPFFNSTVRQNAKTFTNAYYYDALCCPSRATMLSGKYGHNHGVLGNAWNNFQDELPNHLAVWLKAAGVYAIEAGKFLNGYPGAVPAGWSYFASAKGLAYYGPQVAINGTTKQYPDTAYSTIVYTDLALPQITKASQNGTDFFVWLSFHAPHVPSTPETKYATAFPSEKVPRLAPNQKTSDSYDSDYRKMLRTVKSVDDQIKRVVDQLEQLGELDETYIIVTADNGWMPGGMNGLGKTKAVPFDGATRMGLFISGPGITPGNVTALINNADLAPTIAELQGATVPSTANVDGRSFASLLFGGTTHAREVMPLFHKDGSAGNYPGYKGLRTKRYMYVERIDGVRLLFDSQNDPWQTTNIYSTASSTFRQRLADRTRALSTCKASTCRTAENTTL